MRPLTLSFTGLRSYDTFGPVSFEDRSLVGILGDTGAGKSTILEALCVALYGKCSWSDRDVKDLIADGAPTMTVDLTFRHDEHRWRIRRTFYTNTMPTTALLENLDTGAKVDNTRPVDKAIVAMLRMDFTAFRSAVLLPQGRFATLLHATDRERTDLLKGIFGVDTVALVREFAAPSTATPCPRPRCWRTSTPGPRWTTSGPSTAKSYGCCGWTSRRSDPRSCCRKAGSPPSYTPPTATAPTCSRASSASRP